MHKAESDVSVNIAAAELAAAYKVPYMVLPGIQGLPVLVPAPGGRPETYTVPRAIGTCVTELGHVVYP